MTCDRCYQPATEGEHGIGLCPLERRSARAASVTAVTWPGGKTFENLANTPKTFYSPAELNRYMKAHNLEPMVRHQPIPGTDKSPHTTSWDCIAPETLAGAKALLERCAAGGKRERQTYIDSMTVTVTEESGTVRAPRGTFGVFG